MCKMSKLDSSDFKWLLITKVYEKAATRRHGAGVGGIQGADQGREEQ